MRFHADLHIHSKHSRATSRELDLEHLARWAARKGIAVVGTGDCVHPLWLAELKDKLVPAEPGLFRLRGDIEDGIARMLPASCRSPCRFMLSVEISTIYKKGDRTRKIHHLIYAPDFPTVDRLAAALARIGNIASDGRPILGLDSRDLLEIALASGEGAYLVPAHVWTPWFAALGSQSGFDSITECYGDLADHIFAVETGLSSDPAMNWRVSFLDRYRLTSNSDAHSPGKLGREATLFDCEPNYFSIRRALETGAGYVGTVEFFPEEGKYHLDGHRRCGVRLEPKETLRNGGRCPVCGEPVTIGVAHRVELLADRSEEEAVPPATAGTPTSLVPLPEMLAELLDSGPSTKTVGTGYDRLLAALGPELALLGDVPLEDIARADSLLAEAVRRLRAGSVIRDAGYDGEYGVIRLFEEGELKGRRAGGLLFDAPMMKRRSSADPLASRTPEAALDRAETPSLAAEARTAKRENGGLTVAGSDTAPTPGVVLDILATLDDDQRAAAAIVEGPLLIVAGPGSGKTRTLTHRIAHLVAERGVPAESCLAITFTRRAATEMRERLVGLLPEEGRAVPIHTFHALGLAILTEQAGRAGLEPGFRIAGEAERITLLAEALAVSQHKAAAFLNRISRLKRTRQPAHDADLADALGAYDRGLRKRNAIDFDDLVGHAAELLATADDLAALYRERFRFISVDEFQDVDEQQYRLLRLLAPLGGNLCAIGDPNQAIYGFRGADGSAFAQFRRDFPETATVELARNYRSTGTIVAASGQIITRGGGEPIAEIVRGMQERIAVHAAPGEAAEAEFVIATVERLIGGHSFFSIDSGRATNAGRSALGFADFAVLYRTEAQSKPLAEAFSRSGMPFKKSSDALLSEKASVRSLLAALEGAASGAPLSVLLRAAADRLAASAAVEPAALAEAMHWLNAIAAANGDDCARFAAAVALAREADFWDPRADRVSLLTMHAAKGLEFAVVFILGLEDGLMPLFWGERDEANEAEERRLFYVAMTRAKDRLFLTRSAERQWRGRARQLAPSPYLAEIENALLAEEQRPLPRGTRENRQLTLF